MRGRSSALRILAAVAVVTFLAAGCGDDDDGGDDGAATDGQTDDTSAPQDDGGGDIGVDPADLSPTIDNPLFPQPAGRRAVYEGEETDPETGETAAIRVEEEVSGETQTVAGVEAMTVTVTEFEDDELVEETEDYYAQGSDGTVYYLGERVDNYEDGEVADHEGQWLAGEGDARVGVFLPPDPQVGDEFEQERAPGVAEDLSTVVEVGVPVTVPAGSYEGCIETEDVDPLSDDPPEHKFYCPDVGLVQEVFPEDTGTLDLIELETG